MASKEDVLADIVRTLGFTPEWLASVPESTIEAEWSLLKNWEMGETAIPNKYKELIGLGAAASQQCPYSVAFHAEVARLNGATEDEIQEAAIMAKMAAGWSTYLRGTQVDLAQFKHEIREVCDALAIKEKAA